MDIELPIRKILRRDSAEPMLNQSMIERLEPMWVIPYTETELPNRAKERVERLEPRDTKSRMDKEDPMW